MEHGNLQKGERIEMDIEGVHVVGVVVHYHYNDIQIMIQEPFTGMQSGAHMPWFALGARNYSGEFGFKRAREILQEIYHKCLEFEKKKSFFAEQLPLYEMERKIMEDEIEDRKEIILKYRKQFRARQLNHRKYQEKADPIRFEIKELERRIHFLFPKYFKLDEIESWENYNLDFIKSLLKDYKKIEPQPGDSYDASWLLEEVRLSHPEDTDLIKALENPGPIRRMCKCGCGSVYFGNKEDSYESWTMLETRTKGTVIIHQTETGKLVEIEMISQIEGGMQGFSDPSPGLEIVIID